MNTKIFLFSSLVLALLWFAGCDDSIDSIGTGIQPDDDKIGVFDMSLDIKGETVKLDSIYAKSITGLLGKINHPLYGTVQGGYASQFYPSGGFELDSMVTNEIDSIQLKILYYNYAGDSLAPMEVSVFPLRRPLDENYYAHTDLTTYADMSSLLGKQSYTARDLSISDSLNAVNSANQLYKVLSVTLPKELGVKIFEEYKKGNQGAFASPEAFSRFFPGVYIAPTFGSNCLLDVEKTSIYIYYERRWKTSSYSTGNDTIIEGTAYGTLDVTKEVIQMNSYENANDEELLVPNEDKMYIKTPAGVYSKLTIPMSQIVEFIGDRKFSNVKLTVSAYPQSEWKYEWDFPGTNVATGLELAKSKLLLIEPDSVVSFFEEQKAADGLTSFYATLDPSSYTYSFSNISSVLQNAIDLTENEDYKDLELLLIPVTVPYYYSSSDYLQANPIDYATSHYLYPSAITLRKGGDNLRIQIVAADLAEN